jgi:hypothetical protein
MAAEATEDLIADAVVGELNDPARAWAPLPNAAGASYDNTFEGAADLATLRVSVAAWTIDAELQQRGGLGGFDYLVTVVLQQKVDPSDLAAVRALNVLAEQMHDWFRQAHVFAAQPNWGVARCERPCVCDAGRLWEQRTWETYLDLTVRGSR